MLGNVQVYLVISWRPQSILYNFFLTAVGHSAIWRVYRRKGYVALDTKRPVASFGNRDLLGIWHLLPIQQV